MEEGKSNKRPDIPESIKREVRKKCFFGCVICGMPFFQYDHIDEYSEVKEHTEENLVLLCPNHHAAKTTNKLSKERVREAKLNPHNSNRAHTTGFKLEPSKKLSVQLGSNTVFGLNNKENGIHCPIWINGMGFFLIHKEDGWLTFSLSLTDCNGNVLLNVLKGELMISVDAWDYVYEGENIKIRSGLKKILLELNLSDAKVELKKGIFFDENKDGFAVDAGTLLTFINGVCLGASHGGVASNNGFGGWGLLNKKEHPEISKPGSFGFFTEV
ncbi:HNH endonuclease [Pantoea coffeiphila]|uniref:HNH endonuclease n=1 Tax=Pantoea coffeiphila TaxID=1465635 RepID=UPI00195FCAE0|nr:HNH endonuclease [Pantoea coffeiphila]MBM7341666.1 hypothetical protein [Pantoea coffeiphila]